MKLYKLTQEQNTGYDTYDACIVAAETREDARNISPAYKGDFGDGTWADRPDQVTVELIGEAAQGAKSGVILASYNAG